MGNEIIICKHLENVTIFAKVHAQQQHIMISSLYQNLKISQHNL